MASDIVSIFSSIQVGAMPGRGNLDQFWPGLDKGAIFESLVFASADDNDWPSKSDLQNLSAISVVNL
jgi:hypothetical protein